MAFPNFFVFFLFHPFLLNLADSKCQKSFFCKNLNNLLEYPLTDHKHPECGLFKVDCDSPIPIIQLDQWTRYDIIHWNSTNKYMMIDPVLQFYLKNRSRFSFRNMPLTDSPLISSTISPNLTLFKCDKFANDQKIIQKSFKDYENYTSCTNFTVYYKRPEDGNSIEDSNVPQGCSMPMNSSEDSSDLYKLLSTEFTIEWHTYVSKEGGVTISALTAASIILFIFIWKKNALLKLFGLRGAKIENQKEIENLLKNNRNLAPRRYKYSELKKMTNSFCDKLGKGGYGSVYKGKLRDGSLVAVKILNESKGNGEEFMNEVASISRTSHINIVTLLGFCFEGSKRALIYEFLPNGSLEKYIPNSTSAAGLLGWEKLFEIAVVIARGLEYLHQGCNTRILHFDIKPHNILLDKDLKPKISDFGLAKLCPNRSSIVSMLGARGIAGYIAPEVFCRNFGQVSHKSDVYSYGMMVLEMVLGRRNIEPQADRSSETNFLDWIYKNLEQNAETGVDTIFMEEDEWQFAKKKLIIIGLWCIQTEPKNRPSVSRVIEMLEGKVESLQVPPWPYLSSPPRSSPIFFASDSE